MNPNQRNLSCGTEPEIGGPELNLKGTTRGMFGWPPHIATPNVRIAKDVVAGVWFLVQVRLATARRKSRHKILPQTCGELFLRLRHKLLCHGHPTITALAAP